MKHRSTLFSFTSSLAGTVKCDIMIFSGLDVFRKYREMIQVQQERRRMTWLCHWAVLILSFLPGMVGKIDLVGPCAHYISSHFLCDYRKSVNNMGRVFHISTFSSNRLGNVNTVSHRPRKNADFFVIFGGRLHWFWAPPKLGHLKKLKFSKFTEICHMIHADFKNV